MSEIVNKVIKIMSDGLEIFSDTLESLLPQKRKTEFDADFMPVTKRLSIFNKGYCLDGRHCETINDSYKNAIVFGSTGNFKSSGIVIPSILRMHKYASLVINDPSKQLLNKCGTPLHNAGADVKVVDWNNPNCSEGYNPIKRTKTSSDEKKISKILVRNSLGESSKDPFFNLSAENLISFGIRYIKTYTPAEFHTLGNVYHFISALLYAPEKIDRLIVKSNDDNLISEYKSFISYGDKTLASIIATCRTALSIFGTDENVSLITSHDTIDFSEFKRKRKTIFINTKVHDQKYYSVLTSLLLQQFFAELMNDLPDKENNPYPVFFLIEEASSLFFQDLQIILANCRKHSCSILQVYQSKGQLIDLYGQQLARSIIENSFAQVYMGGQSIQVAAELELLAGKFEYENEKGRHVRSLLSANEIHELDESLIALGNNRLIKTKTIPFFKQRSLNQLTQQPPYQPKNRLPFSKPPLLKFD